MARITKQSSIHTTGVSYENEPIVKSDGAGEVMQWQPSDGAADGIFITEGGSAGDPLRLGVGTSPTYAFEVVTGAASAVFEYANHTTGTQTIKFEPSSTKAGGTSKIYSSFAGTGSSVGKLALGVYGATDALTIDSAGTSTFTQAGSDQSGKAAVKAIGTAYGTNKALHGYIESVNANLSLRYLEKTNGEIFRVSAAGASTFSGDVTINKNVPVLKLEDDGGAYSQIYSYDNGALFIEADKTNAGADSKISFSVDNTEWASINGSGLTTVTAITETNGVLKENLLSNSGFDVWSNSTLENATGTNLVTNGDGSSASGWTVISGSLAATGGVLRHSVTAVQYFAQNVTVVVGKLYKIE